MTQKTEHFKKLLQKELKLLETELKTVGQINPDNKKDWEATPPAKDADLAEKEEVAERIEAYEGNTAVLKQLEIKYNEVKGALANIEKGTYGYCTVCKKEIEDDRLTANPAAKTCKGFFLEIKIVFFL